MNHSQTYLDSQNQHLTSGPSYSSQSQTSSGMSQYPQYQSQPTMQSGPTPYGSSHAPGYAQYYGNGLTSPQSGGLPSASIGNQLAPLPAMSMNHHPHQYGGPSSQVGSGYTQAFDASGQVQPPGAKPRVTATLWEDEGSLCFQVEAKGVCVARREDNHFINGTKLLNVAGMTRGRRDGILKSEKVRHVVKIGPMHLKGVWIPFDRALDFANREKITEFLYPLFVHNIGALLYHPSNSSRTNLVMEAARKKNGGEGMKSGPLGTPGPLSAPLLHHHSMNGQMPPHMSQTPHSLAPQPNSNRPNIDRAHTFPTPPTSASSLIGTQGSPYDWSNQSIGGGAVQPAQPLAIDTALSNTRSMPSTPASTPPATTLNNMQSYSGQQAQSYDTSRSMYSQAPQQSQYATQQQNLARFGQPIPPNAYLKNDMGPPSRSGGPEGEHTEIKQDPYSQSQGNDQVGHGAGEEEAEHEHDAEYAQDNTAYSASRGSYSYSNGPGIGPIHGEHPHISQDQVNGSPHQNGGSGRATPRGSISQQWTSGYSTPPRSTTSSSLYNVMSDTRSSLTSGHSDTYPSTTYSPAVVNGTSNKRSRDDDDTEYKQSASSEEMETLKRRKSVHEASIGNISSSPYDNDGRPFSRQRTTIIRSGGRR